ncbi:hypothetical protein DPMN_094628 [Dreissena polymorpha]|uniref:Uncharacterized protein n=1 Tax=Dreissena polymorpha TaxID=45954 RepID=A0A9D4L630_DREPO|nr:hypothetical protein DPMN_094628 [Dreissena polymorpha]
MRLDLKYVHPSSSKGPPLAWSRDPNGNWAPTMNLPKKVIFDKLTTATWVNQPSCARSDSIETSKPAASLKTHAILG